MPKKKEQSEEPNEGVLESAAKTIGTVVGKVVAAVSPTEHPRTLAKNTPEVGRLTKKNKSRLPRKQKKSQNKTA
jgi:hypothetical protein